MTKFLAALFLALTTVMATAQEVEAPEQPASKGPQVPFTAWNGSYRQGIPVEVPAFRSLEPRLSLSYDSARGIRNISSAGGLLGIGWSLDGLSVIERVSGSPAPAAGVDKASGGRGVPAYGAAGLAADSFTLDGDELVACAEVQNQASTPSCTVAVASGQTGFASRVETYQRIRQDSSANTWEVTSRDGTKFLYTSLEGGTAATTFRWHLASVTDRRGNHVDYGWSCDAAFECTIASITYRNQGSAVAIASIAFYTEQRPDPVTYATGKDIRSINRRIRTIEVKNNGSLLRAYRLTYELSASTGLSRLIQVQHFGRDATVAADGAISGGTGLPPYVMNYQNMSGTGDVPAFTASSWGNTANRPGNDINGDGLQPDNYQTATPPNTTPVTCALYLASGNPTRTLAAPASACQNPRGTNIRVRGEYITRDYDGDKADDFITIDHPGSTHQLPIMYGPPRLTVSKWGGSSFVTVFSVAQSGGLTETALPFDGGIDLVADVTGDGLTDILTINNNAWVKNGATMTAQSWVKPVMPLQYKFTDHPNKPIPNRRVDQGDFNGDGKADLLEHWLSPGSGNPSCIYPLVQVSRLSHNSHFPGLI